MAVRDDIDNLEQVIISCLLQAPELVLSQPLDLVLFPRFKNVIHAMVRLSGRGVVVDIISIVDEMEAMGAEMIGISFLGELQLHMPCSPKNYPLYLRKLRDKVNDLTVFESLREGMKTIAAGNPSNEVLGKLVSQSLRLFTDSADRQYSFKTQEMMQLMVDRLEEIYSQEPGAKTLGVMTGISKLDEVLGGLHKSDMCVVGARPSVGKTAFGITVMINAAKNGLKVGFISTELPVEQISFRIAAQVSGLASKSFRSANFDDRDWARITSTLALTQNMNMRIYDKPVMRISDVMMQCRAWDLDGGIDLVIVDYLTRIKPDTVTNNQNLDVGEIATQLKNLARDLKIPVIVLAQLNRNVANRADQKPRMSDLRDSGIIEQEADSILLLNRQEDNNGNNYCSIIIDKNRHGECVEAVVNFEETTGKWWCEEIYNYEN